MRRETRDRAVVARVVALEQQNLVRAHFRRVEPALAGIVDEIGPPRRSRNTRSEATRSCGATLRASQTASGASSTGDSDRPPQIDDGDAAAKQRVGFIGIFDPKARLAGRRGLIDMNAIGGLAGNAWRRRAVVLAGHAAPQRVVEHAHFGGPGDPLQERDGLGDNRRA